MIMLGTPTAIDFHAMAFHGSSPFFTYAVIYMLVFTVCIHVSFTLSTYLSLSAYLSIYLSIYFSIYLYIYISLSPYLFVSLSLSQSKQCVADVDVKKRCHTAASAPAGRPLKLIYA